MRKLLAIILVVLPFLASCNRKEPLPAPDTDGGHTVTFVAGFDVSKTTYRGAGRIDWAQGDVIRYYSSNGGTVRAYELTTSGPSASIKAVLDDGARFIVAVNGCDVDASALHNMDSLILKDAVPTEQGGDFADAHVSIARSRELSDNSSLTFRNLTSLVKFTLKRDDVKYITFTANSGEKIHGDGRVSVTFDDKGNPVPSFSASGGSSIKVMVGSAGTYFIATLPTTLTGGFTMELFDADDSPVGVVVSEASLEIGANTIINLGELDSRVKKVAKSSYRSFDWGSGDVSLTSVVGDVYTIQFNRASAPDIAPGTVFNADAAHDYDLRIVTSSSISGKTAALTTEPAVLADVFSNTTVVLTTSEKAKAQYANTKSSMGNVIVCTPVAYVERDASGRCRYVPKAVTKAVDDTLWKWGYSMDDCTLWENGSTRLSMEKSNFKMSCSINLELSFGNKELKRAMGEGLIQYYSKTIDVKSWLSGNCDVEQILNFDTYGGYEYSTPEDKTLLKSDIVRKGFLFNVSGVPVYIDMSVDVHRKIKASCYYELHFRTGFTDNAECRVGLEWNQSSGLKPFQSFENTLDLIYPTVSGRGTIEGSATIYPRVKFLIYKMLGPTIDVLPYLSESLSGGSWTDDTHHSPDLYCAWGIKNVCHVNGRMGLNLSAFDREVFKISTEELKFWEKDLYHSPSSIKWEENEILAGMENSVTFDVYDWHGLLNKEISTPLPQAVIFEGDGERSTNVAFVKDGKVTVTWTPYKDSDKLYAILYDIERNVIAKAEATCKLKPLCPDDSHIHAIDMGLSVKWACCNLGATKPEEYGDYYAWGETSPKAYYDLNTYAWYLSDKDGAGFIKYCNDPVRGYKGYVDNKTVLDLSDDAAHVRLGGKWRMPTVAEFKELIQNCIIFGTSQNGIEGVKLISKITGNSIFLPVAGTAKRHQRGVSGYYWSTSEEGDRYQTPEHLFVLELERKGTSACLSCGHKSGWVDGLPIRPVSD